MGHVGAFPLLRVLDVVTLLGCLLAEVGVATQGSQQDLALGVHQGQGVPRASFEAGQLCGPFFGGDGDRDHAGELAVTADPPGELDAPFVRQAPHHGRADDQAVGLLDGQLLEVGPVAEVVARRRPKGGILQIPVGTDAELLQGEIGGQGAGDDPFLQDHRLGPGDGCLAGRLQRKVETVDGGLHRLGCGPGLHHGLLADGRDGGLLGALPVGGEVVIDHPEGQQTGEHDDQPYQTERVSDETA